ncbi:MAG: NADH-quinone oxidoreductase subunit C [Acidimicrobiales bacterium]
MPEETATEETATAVDGLRQPILDLLAKELGGDVVASELLAGDDLWVRVNRSAWRRAFELCRDRLGLTYFCFLSGIDWQPNPDLLGEKEWEPAAEVAAIEAEGLGEESRVEEARAELEAGTAEAEASGAEVAVVDAEDMAGDVPAPEGQRYATGVAGGSSRFQVFARLYDVVKHVGVTLKADLDDADPRVESVVSLFRGADWHEREAWEMYGFVFDGHPGLRHLYLPGEFEGHPLRKDFPLLARLVKPWPGLVDVEPIPGEAAGEAEEA